MRPRIFGRLALVFITAIGLLAVLGLPVASPSPIRLPTLPPAASRP